MPLPPLQRPQRREFRPTPVLSTTENVWNDRKAKRKKDYPVTRSIYTATIRGYTQCTIRVSSVSFKVLRFREDIVAPAGDPYTGKTKKPLRENSLPKSPRDTLIHHDEGCYTRRPIVTLPPHAPAAADLGMRQRGD